ncbi:restriction endonuclease subunit M [Gracilimonas halophila]|uniref:Restriction endonuclease subunit M n=1 Tax=Gracilimonas halophila TaxID=1834464 RepID=A0ABW5JHU6_9BACT
MNFSKIDEYIKQSTIKAVENIDLESNKIKYSEKIEGRKISKISGEEEIVRAYLMTLLSNELGYPLEKLEIEREYDIGRPKVNKPRIDLLVKDSKGNPFLYIEVKSPSEYEIDKDEVIEKQLYNLASQEIGKGNTIKYLILYTVEIVDESIKDKCIVIDYEKYSSFDDWKEDRNFVDEIPKDYGKAKKEPYKKGGNKDLETNFSHTQLNALRENLHNVLWGGGGTDDNDVFSSLVNLILAKIQDESEKKNGEVYDFQIFAYSDGESFESNDKLFDRINSLYRRALKNRLNITDKKRLDKSYVIDENKFSLNKLKYTVLELERFSFVDGKNSLDGKDILGDFFEGIIRNGFKQSKGQFFTHINIVRFLLWGLQLDKLAIEKVNNDLELPYLIDPSAGSGTFLIEYMKFITEALKRRFSDKLHDNRDVEDKFHHWFKPDHRENKWASDYIYGIEINFNLGTASKVNMILHGDGSTNIFIKDGLLPYNHYSKETAPNYLNHSEIDEEYSKKPVNSQFDCIITNPPFSVDLDNDTKKQLKDNFLFGDQKNSENLFIERWYQLLKPNGRFGVVLPESVFDTTENRYIRLYLFKYFKIKSVISLPSIAFEPYTSTKTSLLFAQRKTKGEVKKWNDEWDKYSKRWSELKTRVENLIKVYIQKQERSKYPSIKDLTEKDDKLLILELIEPIYNDEYEKMSVRDLLKDLRKEINELLKFDNDIKDVFGYVNSWWVFFQVSKQIDYEIFMAEAEKIGYKRTKRSEKLTENELYRVDEDGKVIVDDGKKETILDYLRDITWD